MKKLLLALSLIFVLYSCKDHATTPPTTESASDYYPLSEGNIWIYTIWTKSAPDSELVLLYNEADQITGTQENNEKTYFVLETFTWKDDSNISEKQYNLLRNDNGKIYTVEPDSTNETLYTDLSLPVGGTCILNSKDYYPTIFKLINKDSKLTLPSVSFDNCMFLESVGLSSPISGYDTKIKLYYAPGVGEVKNETEIRYVSDKPEQNKYEYYLVELKYAKINGKEYGKK
jgi:hypothetical protein